MIIYGGARGRGRRVTEYRVGQVTPCWGEHRKGVDSEVPREPPTEPSIARVQTSFQVRDGEPYSTKEGVEEDGDGGGPWWKVSKKTRVSTRSIAPLDTDGLFRARGPRDWSTPDSCPRGVPARREE